MNRGALQSSPVQQMMASGNPNWWSINNMKPPNHPPHHHHHHHQQQSSSFLAPPNNLYPQFVPNTSNIPTWHNQEQFPESLSQLLLGGLVGGEEDHQEKGSVMSHFQAKKLENWEEQVNVKQEHSYSYGHGSCEEFQANWSHPIMTGSSSSSPKSCVTSFSSNMLDFSNKPDHPLALANPAPPPLPDRSSECNSTANGGALKKARVNNQASTTTTFKVRKEKLGDRITVLHQLVSPFGKTDTASVLLEAIGYIRFLQSQIEALSLPYLGNGTGNMRQQQSVHGERNCMFPEDPGQLLNDNCMKRKGAPNQQDPIEDQAKKDLRSRGLCLVPVSCTLQVGSDNGADYWAPALGGGFR